MYLTNILLKKVKSKMIQVELRSLVTGHRRTMIRERLGDKLEIIAKDPYIHQDCVYREYKKIQSIK